MADKIYPPGTVIRFKSNRQGEVNPLGEIVSYNPDTRLYQCRFYGSLAGWNPALYRAEFTVVSGRQA